MIGQMIMAALVPAAGGSSTPVSVLQSVESVGNGSYPQPTITIADVVAGSTLMLVLACSNDDTAPAFIDQSGQAWSAVKLQYVGVGTVVQFVVWILDNATAGTHEIKLNDATVTPYHCKMLFELAGADPTGSYDSGSVATATAAVTGGSVTSGALAQANEMVISIMSPHIGGVVTNAVSGGFTILADEPNNNDYYGVTVAAKVVAATAAVTADWTCSGGSGGAGLMGMGIFGIKAAS